MSQKKQLSIKSKTEELSKLVSWFNSDEFDIEIAIDKFKQAEKLAEEIEQDLLSLKNEVRQIQQKFDGSVQ